MRHWNRVTDPANRPVPAGEIADPRLTAGDLVEATGGRALSTSSEAHPRRRRRLPRGGFREPVRRPAGRADGRPCASSARRSRPARPRRIVARPPDGVSLDDVDATVIQVDDPLRALQAVAAAWRRRFDPLVIGVTGSIAKTSTKEAIATVLASELVTLKNEGNLNNEIGLPLTVLRLRPDHQAAVLEMGMYVGGEIAELAAIGRPEIGVVTAVQPVHLSRIGTIEAVEQAKGELVEALPPDGVAILNADDERVRRMASRTDARGPDLRVRRRMRWSGRMPWSRPAPMACASIWSRTARGVPSASRRSAG